MGRKISMKKLTLNNAMRSLQDLRSHCIEKNWEKITCKNPQHDCMGGALLRHIDEQLSAWYDMHLHWKVYGLSKRESRIPWNK